MNGCRVKCYRVTIGRENISKPLCYFSGKKTSRVQPKKKVSVSKIPKKVVTPSSSSEEDESQKVRGKNFVLKFVFLIFGIFWFLIFTSFSGKRPIVAAKRSRKEKEKERTEHECDDGSDSPQDVSHNAKGKCELLKI